MNLEKYNYLDYDPEENVFTITMLEDVNRMFEAYQTSPVVYEFINNEIRAKRNYNHNIDNNTVTGYEALGFIWHHRGEVYSLKMGYFKE